MKLTEYISRDYRVSFKHENSMEFFSKHIVRNWKFINVKVHLQEYNAILLQQIWTFLKIFRYLGPNYDIRKIRFLSSDLVFKTNNFFFHAPK